MGLDNGQSNGHIVTVRRNLNRQRDENNGIVAPVLVLCGLLYRGNIGTIVRSAVQANAFERIVIIDGEEQHDQERKCARVHDKDITYYSMINAPLIHIDRFKTIDAFLDQGTTYQLKERIKVATALTKKSLDMYSKDAMNRLRRNNLIIFLGTEADGLPKQILKMCTPETTDCLDCCIQIPTYSASINVSCAFAMVLTVMSVARRIVDGNIAV